MARRTKWRQELKDSIAPWNQKVLSWLQDQPESPERPYELERCLWTRPSRSSCSVGGSSLIDAVTTNKEFTVGHCLIPENVSQNVSPCNKVNKMSNVRELNQRKAVRRQLFSGQGSQNETTGTLYVSPEQRSECCIAVCQSGSNKHDSSDVLLNPKTTALRKENSSMNELNASLYLNAALPTTLTLSSSSEQNYTGSTFQPFVVNEEGCSQIVMFEVGEDWGVPILCVPKDLQIFGGKWNITRRVSFEFNEEPSKHSGDAIIVQEGGVHQAEEDHTEQDVDQRPLQEEVVQEADVNKRSKKKSSNSSKQDRAKFALNRGLQHYNVQGKLIKAKKMRAGCSPSLCRFKCHSKIGDAERQEIFNRFWGLGDKSLQLHSLMSMIRVGSPTVHTSKEEKSHKLNSIKYIFLCSKGIVKVCKKMFLDTFDISESWVKTLIKKMNASGGGTISPDMRGKCRKVRKM